MTSWRECRKASEMIQWPYRSQVVPYKKQYLRSHLNIIFKYWNTDDVSDIDGVFSLAKKDIIRTYRTRFQPDKFQMNIKYTFLTMRVINYKNKLPGKGEDVLLLMFSDQDRMFFW